MAQLLTQQVLGLFGALQILDIGAGAEPARDLPGFIPDRRGPTEGPAIDAIGAPQPVFDLVQVSGFERMPPGGPGALLILGVEHAVPALAVGRPGRRPGELVPAGVVVVVEPVRQGRPHHLRHGIGQDAESGLAFFQGVHGAPQINVVAAAGGDGAAKVEHAHDLARQHLHRLGLRLGQALGPGSGVEHAKCAQGQSGSGLEQDAGIEAQAVLIGHQRIAGEPVVRGRVRHDETVLLQQGVTAERGLERRLANAQPDLRLEPLAVRIDQIDHRDGRVADAGDQRRHVIEIGFPIGIEDLVGAQGRESIILVPGRHQGSVFVRSEVETRPA